MNNPHLMRNREIYAARGHRAPAKTTENNLCPSRRTAATHWRNMLRVGGSKGSTAQHSTAQKAKKKVSKQQKKKAKQRTARSAGRMLATATAGKNYKLMKFMHNKIASEIIDAVVHALNAP